MRFEKSIRRDAVEIVVVVQINNITDPRLNTCVHARTLCTVYIYFHLMYKGRAQYTSRRSRTIYYYYIYTHLIQKLVDDKLSRGEFYCVAAVNNPPRVLYDNIIIILCALGA